MPTERDKMLAGAMYDPLDAELVALRRRARDLTHFLNASRDADTELRAKWVAELIGVVGEGAYIEPPFHCDYGLHITLGRKVYFNFGCVILDVTPVTIGDNVMFAPGVHIYAATHPIDAKERNSGFEYGRPVTIGSDVWVGGGSIVCPGVTIGAGTVIGAGSVVTKDIPAGVVAAGNPCRVIREIAVT